MNYTALITYQLIMTITPGPNNIMVTASGNNFGYRATLPHIFGICTGGAVQFMLVCFGLAAIFEEFPIIHKALAWVGLLYMFFLAWKIATAKIADSKKVGKPISFLQASLFQFVNPKAWVMIATEASVFLPQNEPVLVPALIIVLIGTAICFPCVSFWTLFGQAMRRFLKTDKNQIAFNMIMAALLVGTAIMIMIN